VRGQVLFTRGRQRKYSEMSEPRCCRYVWVRWTSPDGGGVEGGELVLRELTERATTGQLLQFLAPQAPFVSSLVGKLFGTRR